LPYARRLTELLGGHLRLTSQPGRGTTVTLRLPHGTPALGVVLIADDDAGFRQVVRGLLAGLTGEVIEAADGEAALAAARAGPVDLALVDLRMPGLDGYALLERLPAGIPAIVITSGDPGELPTRASGLLRKDQLTADRLRYAINRIRGAGDE
jgi:CheY-like chemotaxis protein